jgi:hypothetical protein
MGLKFDLTWILKAEFRPLGRLLCEFVIGLLSPMLAFAAPDQCRAFG